MGAIHHRSGRGEGVAGYPHLPRVQVLPEVVVRNARANAEDLDELLDREDGAREDQW